MSGKPELQNPNRRVYNAIIFLKECGYGPPNKTGEQGKVFRKASGPADFGG
jgi:hypothetical protein